MDFSCKYYIVIIVDLFSATLGLSFDDFLIFHISCYNFIVFLLCILWGSSRKKVLIVSRDSRTNWTGTRMRSSTEGISGNSAVQFQSCEGSSYCIALGENGCTDIVSCQLRDSYGYQISARSKAISSRDAPPILCHVHGTDIISDSVVRVIHSRPNQCAWRRPSWPTVWWKVCDKQFCRIGASQFRNSLINSPRWIWYQLDSGSWQCSNIRPALCNNYFRHRTNCTALFPHSLSIATRAHFRPTIIPSLYTSVSQSVFRQFLLWIFFLLFHLYN